jgi:hypothetical protein
MNRFIVLNNNLLLLFELPFCSVHANFFPYRCDLFFTMILLIVLLQLDYLPIPNILYFPPYWNDVVGAIRRHHHHPP